ncbi:hypothetical protein [Streptomyces sp. NPDC047525]|uniref:hypothetical protein n=1 Tax=Streptomyces sp. NPDC047525 TaxID=3155264 RepID=UPI0033DCBF58
MSISSAASGLHRRQRRTVVVATALLVTATAAGCGGEEKEPASSPTPSATKSADAQAKAKQEVLTVYRHYWDAQVKAYAKADPKGSGLEKVAFGKAYSKTFAELATMKGSGTVLKGKPRISPASPDVNVAKSPKEATLRDCVDVSDWKLVKAKSGKEVPLPKERLTKFVTDVSARTVGGKWMIVEATTGRKC